MNIQKIKTELKDFEQVKVDKFCNYLQSVSTEKDKDGVLKHQWPKYAKDEEVVYFFKQVADTGLWLDGEMITLQFKGKLMVSFDYNAYKNLVLLKYPESTFDMQIVREGDEFSFNKESGRVIYSHKIKSAFTDTKIIGAYCIIKNKKGEFLEPMSHADIEKCRKIAKTQSVWNTWYDRMALKSVIRRACNAHFKDVIVKADKLDNENYDLNKLECEKPDAPLEFFKKLVKDQKDKEIWIENFRIMDNEARRNYYREVAKVIKEKIAK